MALDPFADPFATPAQNALSGEQLASNPLPITPSPETQPGTWPDQPHPYGFGPDPSFGLTREQKLEILKRQRGGQTDPRIQLAGDILPSPLHAAPLEMFVGPGAGSGAARPALIGQRLPSGARAKAPAAERKVDIETMKQTPQTTTQIKAGTQPYFRRAVDLAKNYSSVPQQWGVLDSDTFAAAFVTQMKNNLLWLHDQYQWKDRASKWYDGGNTMLAGKAQQYGLRNEATAGVYAALSPMKDWFQNVELGNRVLATVMDPKIRGTTLTPEMASTFEQLTAVNPKTGKAGNPELARLFPAIAGKSYDQVRALDMPADEKALLQAAWVRLYDQAYRPLTYNVISPEGQIGAPATNADGTPATLVWQSLKMIGNAVRMIESNGRDAETVLGYKHKVRNFYNNLLDPRDASSVTIDTHAVSAALLQPFGASDLEVAHNFGNNPPPGLPAAPESDVTGMRGSYGLYAEAYRQAAAERGILPRQMQSITWEASRGLFANKSVKQKSIIKELWQRYRRGQASIEDTRAAVFNASGGINAPDWAGGSAAAPHGAPQGAANPGQLPGVQLPGPGAGRAVGRGGNGPAGAVPPAAGVTPEGAAALGAGAY
jgi:hypothetical protein